MFRPFRAAYLKARKPRQKIRPLTGYFPANFFLDRDITIGTIIVMGKIEDIVVQLRQNPKGIRFVDLCRVCDHYFGTARQKGTSHRIYKTPWQGDPRVNIQNSKGKAKAYQVKQVLKAIERLEHESHSQ